MEESYNEDEDLEADFKKLYNDIIRFAIQKVKTEGESIEDAINSAAAKYEINAEDLGMESLMKKVYHGVHKD
jgi:hypothetical protein